MRHYIINIIVQGDRRIQYLTVKRSSDRIDHVDEYNSTDQIVDMQ